jgi:hypothetical protein
MVGRDVAVCLPLIYHVSKKHSLGLASINISWEKTVSEYLNTALEMLDEGWWVVPIHPNEKRPVVKWGELYDEGKFPTEEQVIQWWETFPNSYVGIVTGELSGVLVVDCDNEEAEAYAREVGLTQTPWVVQTKRGKHFYFKYPKDAGHIKTLTWSNADGVEWPRDVVKGLDRKAHKGIALVPPTPNYTQLSGDDWDDVPVYPVKNYGFDKPSNVVSFDDFKFGNLSLAHIKIKKGVVETTRELVEKMGRKLMAGVGDNRHQMLVSLAGELAAQGHTREICEASMIEYVAEFFYEPHKVDRKEFQSVIDHAYAKEDKKPKIEEPKPEPSNFKPITTFDADRLAEEASKIKYFVDPIIPDTGTIIQVHGYSGHGKSMFIRHLLYAASAGAPSFGPFDIHKKPRVLYLDFENSKQNISKFLTRSRRSFGDAEGRFMIWTPFIDDKMMNLKEDAGINNLQSWINFNKPEIVVIDTIRTAWSGLQENSAEEWGNINKLALTLRNAGMTVILVHHSNKPADGGRSGREAGSSNQLTVLETQIKVTQVYADKETADVKAGIYDGDIPRTPYTMLGTAPVRTPSERLQVCMELRYGKVREWSDAHEPVMYIAFLEDENTENVRVVSESTAKQRAIKAAQPWTNSEGVVMPPLSDREISNKVGKPVSVVADWTKHLRQEHIESHVSNAKANL